MTDRVLAVILAGGKGSRLEPLTRDRAKPAVPFGGAYRIIDFTLSNCLNSGLRQILVLTQYKAMSLDRHINRGWRGYFCREMGEFLEISPHNNESTSTGIWGPPTPYIRTSTPLRRNGPSWLWSLPATTSTR